MYKTQHDSTATVDASLIIMLNIQCVKLECDIFEILIMPSGGMAW